MDPVGARRAAPPSPPLKDLPFLTIGAKEQVDDNVLSGGLLTGRVAASPTAAERDNYNLFYRRTAWVQSPASPLTSCEILSPNFYEFQFSHLAELPYIRTESRMWRLGRYPDHVRYATLKGGSH